MWSFNDFPEHPSLSYVQISTALPDLARMKRTRRQMEGGAREGTIAVVENCVVVLFGSGLLLGSLSVKGM